MEVVWDRIILYCYRIKLERVLAGMARLPVTTPIFYKSVSWKRRAEFTFLLYLNEGNSVR